jgi:hypothetical protein
MTTVAEFKEYLSQFPDDAVLYEWMGGSKDGLPRFLRPKRFVLQEGRLYVLFAGAHMSQERYDSADKIFEPEN